MKLVPKINPEIIKLLSFTPLQYMLRAVEHSPEIGMVYADDETEPSSCVVRIGSLLFFGGRITPEHLEYLKAKILTFEIYEKYGVFYFFYPNERWGNVLTTLFSNRGKVYRRTLYAANSTATAQTHLTSVVPINTQLMESDVKNREMIINEVTTYKTFDSFLKDGIGYSALVDGEIQGFCTSEYQSKNELAIGIEVVLDLRDLNRGKRAPEECDVFNAVQKHLTDVKTVKRVPKGASTYVYQARTSLGIYYARFLPEDCSFAAEVTAHRLMAAAGAYVPRIVAFEHKEAKSGLSMMLAEEIPGICMEDAWPDDNAADILREAGRQLALIHSISVDGFGWIDRSSYDTLKGEKNSFREYFCDYLDDDLNTLNYYDFSTVEVEQIRGYMEQARLILDVENAVLVHGDFDISHIFHSSGKFSGFIDFGEIRGNNRFFDLATFTLNDVSPDRMAYYRLIEGYRETTRLTDDDLYAVELMALFIVLRFAGKKVETKSRKHWYRLLKRQLERVCQ